ncbi:hypothetical protein [Streptomyces sp. NPDC060322]|uniref:hypothetical protein n=1 Tax=Streptomyces sp. NPDC060322 TaxID=3347097 RepID=UPI00365E1C94
MTTYDFPQDLCDARLALHQTRATYEQYARTLPWSAGPTPGWEGDKQLHSDYRSSRPYSPGYTEDQHRELAVFRARFLEVGAMVSTYPFRSTRERGAVVAGRMALEHIHEAVAAAADQAA